MTINYLTDPLGVDDQNPKLSWSLNLNQKPRGTQQVAYKLLVTRMRDNYTMWQTNLIKSSESSNIQYQGESLKSDIFYQWQVQISLSDASDPQWSDKQSFKTGLFNQSEWLGKWLITPNNSEFYYNTLRKEFTLNVSQPPSRASCFISGVGYYELYINGKKIGNNKLDVGWTTWDKTVLYSSYDVTDNLLKSQNAIGIWMGRGWWGQQNKELKTNTHWAVILQCNFYDQNDQILTSIYTNSSWKMSTSAIVADDIYGGEHYNSNHYQQGWDMINFDDSKWAAVNLGQNSSQYPSGQLSSQQMEPIQTIKEIQPVRYWQVNKTDWVFDLGQHISGWIRIKVSGEKKQQITMKYAEILQHGSGFIYTAELEEAKATDIFILAAAPPSQTQDIFQVYEPRFTYHGFQYIQITGLTQSPDNSTVTGIYIRSGVKQISDIKFSIPILNQIQRLVLWSQGTNLMSVPTDCDNRNERKGWMGDAALTCDVANHNYAMGAFYSNFLRNIEDAQNEDGSIPDTVPFSIGSKKGDPNWASAFPTILHNFMTYQGDHLIVQRYLPSIKKYLLFLDSHAKFSVANMYYNYGDWYPPQDVPRENGSFTSMFAFLHDLKLYADISEFTNNLDEKFWAQDLFEKYAFQFNSVWFSQQIENVYSSGLQTGQALPLWLQISPNSSQVLQNLIQDIKNTHNTHLNTGIIGTKFLLLALSDYGKTDIALELAIQDTYPSWGYMIKNNIEETTTLWELWHIPWIQPGKDASRNHIMFGSQGSWYFTNLAGISQIEKTYGYRNIKIQPSIQTIDCDPNNTKKIQFVYAEIVTIKGYLLVDWKCTNQNQFDFHLIIPFASNQAVVYIPASVLKLDKQKLVLYEDKHIIFEKGQQTKFLPPGIQTVFFTDVPNEGLYIKVVILGGEYQFHLQTSEFFITET